MSTIDLPMVPFADIIRDLRFSFDEDLDRNIRPHLINDVKCMEVFQNGVFRGWRLMHEDGRKLSRAEL